jgi:hypothetical protein
VENQPGQAIFPPGTNIQFEIKGGRPVQFYSAFTNYTTLINWINPVTSGYVDVPFYLTQPDQNVEIACTITTPDLTDVVEVGEVLDSVGPNMLPTTAERRAIGSFQVGTMVSNPPPSYFLPGGPPIDWFCLHGATIPPIVTVPYGIYILSWLDDPPLQTTSQSNGQFAFVQLLTDRSRAMPVMPPHQEDYFQPVRVKGLDHVYPYSPWIAATPYQTNIYAKFSDRPRFELDSTIISYGIYDADFETYIFYVPPSSPYGPSIPVAVRVHKWKVDSRATFGSTGWFAAGSNLETFVGGSQDYPPIPTWNAVINP